MTLEAYILNVGIYSIFPLYFATLKNRVRTAAFYNYLSIVLLVGGLAGAVYSFPLSEALSISGGNIAYGAFMMSTIMLIIIERDFSTFKHMFRLVVVVDLIAFVGFNFMAWLLESEYVLNPFAIPFSIFDVSLKVLVLGGVLILLEILLLMFIFTQVSKFLSNLPALAFIYTLAFVFILCLDGALFPLLAFGLSPQIVPIIFGNIMGKLLIAACYSVPMLIFYFLFRGDFAKFVSSPLSIKDLTKAPRKELLATLYQYELRDEQLQREKQDLTKIALFDELTSLPNRRKFNQTFESEWARCEREGQALTLVIGDIDFFKQYNDAYGHHQGDVCLKQVAKLWKQIFNRPSDLAARIGGEEFAIILPSTSTEQSIARLNSFLTVLHSQPIPHRSSPIASHVTMSLGVAECVPTKSTSPNDLFMLADKRLYKAKNSGRNQVIVD
ncbi:GGDEF domain-containing protein [Vibrio lentus]|uniref:GGDEF domain-containing protein n=1 Tax=Vibrio lentus TaxID=136468 RepID=UPI00178CA163|nr:GGDEF domain-containing protein [Vibrio lentus]MDN3629628.1 GGDEF domain-containing protein [Vibrio lentus]